MHSLLQDFLSPVNVDLIANGYEYLPNQWGTRIGIHNSTEELPDMLGVKIAIIGVEEDRKRTDDLPGCAHAPNAIRRQLYKMQVWQDNFKVVDLGNIKSGESQSDTFFAIEKVVRILLNDKITPIILGGTHDLSYGQFMGHGKDGRLVNAVVFDETIDLFLSEEEIAAESFLYKMLTQRSSLFNFSHIGHQRYLVDPRMVSTLEELHFECYGLGELKPKVAEVEPIIRNAHLVSFDMSAICHRDAPGVDNGTPNGFGGDDACRIARYAGVSDHVRSFGIYQYNPYLDQREQTAMLISQMVWYFVDGFFKRRHDLPELDERGFLKYIVNFRTNDHTIEFVKSKKSDRWWMKVPVLTNGEEIGEQLIPCSYGDYEMAAKKEEIPDRWMKAYHRFCDL